MGRRTDRKWPVAPFLEWVAGESLVQKAERLPVTVRTLHRWSHQGIPERTADWLACKVLSIHPSFIWDDWDDWEAHEPAGENACAV